jgi:hypothetical protein
MGTFCFSSVNSTIFSVFRVKFRQNLDTGNEKMTPEKKKTNKQNWAREREREREGSGKKNAKEPMKNMSTFLNRKTLHDFRVDFWRRNGVSFLCQS